MLIYKDKKGGLNMEYIKYQEGGEEQPEEQPDEEQPQEGEESQ
jgi:hypothetical protein